VNRRIFPSILLLILAFFPGRGFCAELDSFVQTNLTSDLPGVAQNTDPNLVNPWGMAFSATSPIWVSDNRTGLATIYNGTGLPLSLVVTIPGVGDAQGTPTGQVFNGTSAFNSDPFVFASEDGLVSGWRGALGTTAEVLADNSGAGSVFKGLALATIGSNSYLYAADFHNNQIVVTPSAGAPALTGNFTDPTLPAGYAPFDIKNIGGQLYVTYALQDAAKHDEVPGAGNGFVDVFDTSGTFVKRLISGGALNSPWGMAIAPAGFGPFGGKLLVGNFGDGKINVYDPTTGTFLDTLDDQNGNPIAILGLWGLEFGNGAQGTSTDALYFTAGIPEPGGAVEDHGLFGNIQQTPEPSSIFLLGSGLVGALGAIRRKLAS